MCCLFQRDVLCLDGIKDEKDIPVLFGEKETRFQSVWFCVRARGMFTPSRKHYPVFIPFAPTCFLNRLLITFRQPQPKWFEVNRRGACQARSSLSADWTGSRDESLLPARRSGTRSLLSREKRAPLYSIPFFFFFGCVCFLYFRTSWFYNSQLFLSPRRAVGERSSADFSVPSGSWNWNALFCEYTFFLKKNKNKVETYIFIAVWKNKSPPPPTEISNRRDILLWGEKRSTYTLGS